MKSSEVFCRADNFRFAEVDKLTASCSAVYSQSAVPPVEQSRAKSANSADRRFRHTAKILLTISRLSAPRCSREAVWLCHRRWARTLSALAIARFHFRRSLERAT